MSNNTINKVNPETKEFKDANICTIKFTDEVLKEYGFVYNPDKEVVQGVQHGLTRNKIIYDNMYCPCFFVTKNSEEDRICPCRPALEIDIPGNGTCHCGIFCTPEFAKIKKQEMLNEEIVQKNSFDLSKKECELLLNKTELESSDLEVLLAAKRLGMVNFQLIDVREWMEHKNIRIKGTDHLVPTSSFYESVKVIDKAIPAIIYCHIGSRSAYCQRIMNDMGCKHVGNLTHGIVSYQGEIERG